MRRMLLVMCGVAVALLLMAYATSSRTVVASPVIPIEHAPSAAVDAAPQSLPSPTAACQAHHPRDLVASAGAPPRLAAGTNTPTTAARPARALLAPPHRRTFPLLI